MAPFLMIGIVNGEWAVQIENVPDLAMAFRGADLATQAQWVREFASQMSEGTAEFAVSTLEGVDIEESAQAIGLLFESTGGIILEGETIFMVGEEATLIDFLVEAGTALLEFL